MLKGKALLFTTFCLVLVSVTSQDQSTQIHDHPDIATPSQPKQPFNLVEFILKNITDTEKFFFEFMLVCLLAVYILNYFMGKKLNQKYALLWVQENKPLFDAEFAHIGVTNSPVGALLDSESAHSFKFYASGRQNVASCLVSLDLKKRQDLLSMFIFNFIWPEKDHIRVDIPIETTVHSPFVFSVVKRREAKNLQNNLEDVKNFCRKVAHPELEKQYTVFTENDEIFDFFLTKQVVATLKKYENVIESITFSDLRVPGKQFLRAELNVPSNLLKNPKEYEIIFKMLFYLIDNLQAFKMSSGTRAKAEKDRQAYEEAKNKEKLKEKQEEIQKKLQEKKKEEAGKKKVDEKKEELRQKKKMQRKFVKMI